MLEISDHAISLYIVHTWIIVLYFFKLWNCFTLQTCNASLCLKNYIKNENDCIIGHLEKLRFFLSETNEFKSEGMEDKN